MMRGRLAAAIGISALSVILLTTSALAAGMPGTGSGTMGGGMPPTSGGTTAGNQGTSMGSGTAGSYMSGPSGAGSVSDPGPSTAPAPAGNIVPQVGTTMMGNGSVPAGQGIGYQMAPGFTMGFGTMASMMGDVVGQPLENEHYGPNGDSLQQTTTGMMVWRKADNWTAFTNGAMTWVNGPYGLQMRPNTERFPWEAQ